MIGSTTPEPPMRRKRKPPACVRCRKRKIGCDRVHPICGNCFRLKRLDCTYPLKDNVSYSSASSPPQSSTLQQNMSPPNNVVNSNINMQVSSNQIIQNNNPQMLNMINTSTTINSINDFKLPLNMERPLPPMIQQTVQPPAIPYNNLNHIAKKARRSSVHPKEKEKENATKDSNYLKPKKPEVASLDDIIAFNTRQYFLKNKKFQIAKLKEENEKPLRIDDTNSEFDSFISNYDQKTVLNKEIEYLKAKLVDLEREQSKFLRKEVSPDYNMVEPTSDDTEDEADDDATSRENANTISKIHKVPKRVAIETEYNRFYKDQVLNIYALPNYNNESDFGNNPFLQNLKTKPIPIFSTQFLISKDENLWKTTEYSNGMIISNLNKGEITNIESVHEVRLPCDIPSLGRIKGIMKTKEFILPSPFSKLFNMHELLNTMEPFLTVENNYFELSGAASSELANFGILSIFIFFWSQIFDTSSELTMDKSVIIRQIEYNTRTLNSRLLNCFPTLHILKYFSVWKYYQLVHVESYMLAADNGEDIYLLSSLSNANATDKDFSSLVPLSKFILTTHTERHLIRGHLPLIPIQSKLNTLEEIITKLSTGIRFDNLMVLAEELRKGNNNILDVNASLFFEYFKLLHIETVMISMVPVLQFESIIINLLDLSIDALAFTLNERSNNPNLFLFSQWKFVNLIENVSFVLLGIFQRYRVMKHELDTTLWITIYSKLIHFIKSLPLKQSTTIQENILRYIENSSNEEYNIASYKFHGFRHLEEQSRLEIINKKLNDIGMVID
ncbi:Zn(II)2Cys6 transcription factor domain-containing protein NDAI_0D01770 [Naumovozyma dairenensis CBS 421]|uniref:Zn(2)-C6 fungal-type domain-containing protein n=1 Tax=Naumovozyma dairenensis (strain ATCC 10597 / BCRC 20456 / CBS 421 / NBRC 0211 / NRRL Y-12639) TaxID=1071378 RepID=G0W9N0_NAUDC|nr:hypothetical protein NDAI_0D01770 [Naumovozyma dairenensis CBS 421]CCD24491.1 hypothetical protein NDAI_0D01770 [Naumovozyma dairenensis CBS 421]